MGSSQSPSFLAGTTVPHVAVAAAVLGGLVIVGRSISLSGGDAQSESATEAAATTAAAVAAATAAAPAEAAIFDAAVATEAPPATDAASARPATVVTIGSIDGGATAGDTQSNESAPASAESTAESSAEFAETTVVSLTVEEQLQAYVASLIGTVAERKAAQVPTNCLVNGVAIENVSWQGLAGVLVLSPDATDPTTAEIIDSTCGVLVRVAITR